MIRMVLAFGFFALCFVLAIPRIPSAWKSPDPDMQAGVMWWIGSVVVLGVTLLAYRLRGDTILTRLLAFPAIVACCALVPTTFVLGGGEWTKYEDTCAYVNERYPNGVALDRRTANLQSQQGNGRPMQDEQAYEASRALDHDRDGTACEQPETSRLD